MGQKKAEAEMHMHQFVRHPMLADELYLAFEAGI